MSNAHEFHQIHLPPSFTDLYKDPTRPYAKPVLSFAEICERYELCEDMAQMLCEPSLNQMAALHITEEDVIERNFQGLRLSPELLNAQESIWVMQRLCELLNWSLEDLKIKLEATLPSSANPLHTAGTASPGSHDPQDAPTPLLSPKR